MNEANKKTRRRYDVSERSSHLDRVLRSRWDDRSLTDDHAKYPSSGHALEHTQDGRRTGSQPQHRVRHWQANGLKPHLVRGLKVSRDPQFVEKIEDIVGLYMSPAEHALGLCCDEKSQALDRTQPGLPLKKGRSQTMTHDYKRHGTTTLFAALNVLDGQIIGQCQQRHTYVEWLRTHLMINRWLQGLAA